MIESCRPVIQAQLRRSGKLAITDSEQANFQFRSAGSLQASGRPGVRRHVTRSKGQSKADQDGTQRTLITTTVKRSTSFLELVKKVGTSRPTFVCLRDVSALQLRNGQRCGLQR
jgi:hypothetical protein